MVYYACDIPEDLYYDIERDVWIRFEDDIAVLGMTDVAQTRCGKFAAISFRDVGKKVVQGKTLATIESANVLPWTTFFPTSRKLIAANFPQRVCATSVMPNTAISSSKRIHTSRSMS